MSDPVRRRAALIATAVAVPVVVIAVFAIGAVNGANTSPPKAATAGPITASAPPLATQQTVNCTKVLEKLQPSLDGLAPRVVHTDPSTPFVVAWGDPAIVLSCGVARPEQLHPGSGVQYRDADGLDFVLDLTKSAATYTTVDRAAYISIRFPAGVQPANHLPTLVRWIRAALPTAVCSTDEAAPNVDTLCTRRK